MTVPATPGSPTTIGRYPVSRRLGAGAFATVWLGRDTDFDVDVAIKVLADNWAADPAIRERFLTEAKFLRRIRDRRVVHVYDIGTLDDGRPYFVMDYLDAGSLEDLRRSGVAPAEALRLCAEAARGLEVLHRHHLVHRDVTPGNLLLTSRPDGSRAVVVADLGVARSVLDSSAGAMVVGTPSYMAPEQAGGGAVDPRADVYALCAVAYALLTGGPPFPVLTIADLTGRPADVAPPPLAAATRRPGHPRRAVPLGPGHRPAPASAECRRAGRRLRPARRRAGGRPETDGRDKRRTSAAYTPRKCAGCSGRAPRVHRRPRPPVGRRCSTSR